MTVTRPQWVKISVKIWRGTWTVQRKSACLCRIKLFCHSNLHSSNDTIKTAWQSSCNFNPKQITKFHYITLIEHFNVSNLQLLRWHKGWHNSQWSHQGVVGLLRAWFLVSRQEQSTVLSLIHQGMRRVTVSLDDGIANGSILVGLLPYVLDDLGSTLTSHLKDIEMTCQSGGRYWDYYPGTLSLSRVTTTPLKIDRAPTEMKSMGAQSLTYWGLVMLYGNISLGQHWLR